MHPAAWSWIAEHIGTPATVIDLGGRDVNGHPRSLAPEAAWTVVDVAEGANVDVVADAATWLPPSPVDLVICAEVLEHTPDGAAIVANARRMLQPDGRLILTMAGPGRAPHSAVDGGPVRGGEWYRNVGTTELEMWLRAARFHRIMVEELGEDVRAVAWR